MTTLTWQDGLRVERRLCTPMRSGASVASHLIEHPIGYDGSPEHMLMTLGASLWVRQGPRWYTEHRSGLYFEDVIAWQLDQVMVAMGRLGRLIDDAPKQPRLPAETEDLIWSILMRANEHALTGDAQIVQLTGWLRHGVWTVVERWQATRDQLYDTFTTACGALDALIAEYDAGAHPPHRRWRVGLRPQRNTFRLEPT